MKKFFTLITMFAMVLVANAQEKLILSESNTYADKQEIKTEKASVTLGNDQVNAAYAFENEKASGSYFGDFIQNCKDKDGADISGVVNIHGGNNPKDKVAKGAGSGINCSSSKTTANLPQNGTYYIFKATTDGKVKLGIVLNAGKAFYLIDATNATVNGDYLQVALPDANLHNYTIKNGEGTEVTLADADDGKGGKSVDEKTVGFVEFEAKANHSYYFFCAGSKLGFFGYEFTEGTISGGGDDPQPTEEGTKESVTMDAATTAEKEALSYVRGSAEDHVSVEVANVNKFDSTKGVHMKKGSTVTVNTAAGTAITKVAFTIGGASNASKSYWTVDGEKLTNAAYKFKEETQEWTFTSNKQSLTFTVGNDAAEDGVFYLTKVEVTYSGTPTETLAVSSLKAEGAVNGAIYNLAGQKVSENYKGVVVKNGKKVVMK